MAYPSLKDYVGGQIKEGPGHAASHSEIVIQTLTGKTRLTQADGRCLITENHKYVLHQWGENREQLFDRKKDPGEEVNLALETRYQATLAPLSQLGVIFDLSR